MARIKPHKTILKRAPWAGCDDALLARFSLSSQRICSSAYHVPATASQEPRIRCARDLRLTVSDRAREQILPTACDAARHGHAAKANDRDAGAARAQLYCLHVLRNPPVNRSRRLQSLTLQRNRELRQGAAAIQGAPGCPPQFRRAPRL